MGGKSAAHLSLTAAIARDPDRVVEPLPAFDEVACPLFVGWDDQLG